MEGCNMKHGRIIGIDGMDGSGKNTQSKLLYEYLIKSKVPTKFISFPNYENGSSSLVKEYLNGNLYTDQFDLYAIRGISLSYAIDRHHTFYGKNKDNPNQPKLIDYYRDGYTIVCDRYIESNYIYMSAKYLMNELHGQHITDISIKPHLTKLKSIIKFIKNMENNKLKIPKASKTIFLTVNPDKSIENLISRGAKLDIHEAIRMQVIVKFLIEFFQHDLGYVVLNCMDNQSNNIKSIDMISDKIRNIVTSTIYKKDKSKHD
jgi:dTMP kinase